MSFLTQCVLSIQSHFNLGLALLLPTAPCRSVIKAVTFLFLLLSVLMPLLDFKCRELDCVYRFKNYTGFYFV